jgi:hypothetical protein
MEAFFYCMKIAMINQVSFVFFSSISAGMLVKYGINNYGWQAKFCLNGYLLSLCLLGSRQCLLHHPQSPCAKGLCQCNFVEQRQIFLTLYHLHVLINKKVCLTGSQD